MELPRDGVEYAQVVFDQYPTVAVTIEASLDRVTWFAFDVEPSVQTDGSYMGKVLLRGPNSTSMDGHLVSNDSTVLWVRLTENPEIIPLRAGIITFY